MKCSIGDAHLYENSISAVKEQMSRESYDMMKLVLPVEINELKDLECLTADDFLSAFEEYQHHPAIRVPVCVG